jgi:hypothetical protein
VGLIRLEHDYKFGDIKAPDGNQGSGAEFRGVPSRISNGIADLAQRHQPKRRRQLDRWRTAPQCDVQATSSPDSTFQLQTLMLFFA